MNLIQNKNPKLIVKNALLLLTRFFLSMLLSFYSTRLTLQVLNDVDYGINNIIGGLISMFAVVSLPITTSLQRYFNVELAKNEIEINVVFNTSLRMILYLIAIMILLYETIGLYVVWYVLDYPVERAFAVEVSYQITALVTILSFLTIPFMALFYAKEMMGLPAGIELIGNVFKILFLFAIPYLGEDMLILFTIATCLISFIQLIVFYTYSKYKMPEIRLKWIYDKGLYKSMLKFSGWNSIESVAGISLAYLSNILINVFGGVVDSTAEGLSRSITNAVLSFTTNVMKAVEPQITSATVLGDNRYRDELVCLSIKISMLATCFVSILFYYDGYYFLGLWLGHVPLYAYEFCFVMITASIFSTIILPLRSLIMAKGKVKSYFTTYGIIAFCVITIMFILLKIGFDAIVVVYFCAVASLMNLLSAIFHACYLTKMNIKVFLSELGRVAVVAILMLAAYYSAHAYLFVCSSLSSIVISSTITIFTMMVSMGLFGLNTTERNILREKIRYFRKIYKK